MVSQLRQADQPQIGLAKKTHRDSRAVAPSNTTADSADQAGQLQIGLAKKTRRFQELTFIVERDQFSNMLYFD